MIGRYGGCFEEGIWWVYGTDESLRGTREASNGGRVRVTPVMIIIIRALPQ